MKYLILCLLLPIQIFALEDLYVKEVKMFPRIAILIKDRESGREAAYIMDYEDFEDNPGVYKIIKRNKPVDFGRADEIFWDSNVREYLYGLELPICKENQQN